MFRDNFYKVDSSTKVEEGSFKSTLTIDKTHPIFKGHFPAVPVVPGVVMMQMIKELFEAETKQQFSLAEAGAIKFLSVINPNEAHQLEVAIKYIPNEDKTYRLDASITANNVVCFKLAKAIYK